MVYSLIDLSKNTQDNRYPVTNDLGLIYQSLELKNCDKITG
jgi:hypothetical protein